MWFREGMLIPFQILGLLKSSTVISIKEHIIIRSISFIGFISGLISLLSDVVQIVVGWDKFSLLLNQIMAR